MDKLSINDILQSSDFKRFVSIKSKMTNNGFKKTTKQLNIDSLLEEYLAKEIKKQEKK